MRFVLQRQDPGFSSKIVKVFLRSQIHFTHVMGEKYAECREFYDSRQVVHIVQKTIVNLLNFVFYHQVHLGFCVGFPSIFAGLNEMFSHKTN